MMQSEVFIKTLKGEKSSYTPVWLMRQAGRYLKEYRELKSKYSFLDLCKTPELAAKITMMPAKLGVDVLIIFSDILIPLLLLDAEIEYKENNQPKVKVDLEKEYKPNFEKLNFLKDTIKIVKEEKPEMALLGFAATPFTLLCYVFGGQDFSNIKALIYSNTDKFNKISAKITKITSDYLNFQIEAGCDAIQLFDSWAGILPKEIYKKFVLPFNEKVVKNLNVPSIYFIKNSCHINDELDNTPFNCISIDSRSSLKDIYCKTKKCVQGNLDNSILLTNKETIKRETAKILKETEEIPHIFNLSHGVLPSTNPENIEFLVDFIHNETSKY